MMFLLWSLPASADVAPSPEPFRSCTIAAWSDKDEEGQVSTEAAIAPLACTTLTEQGHSRRRSDPLVVDDTLAVVLCRTRTEPTTLAPPDDAPSEITPHSPRHFGTFAG
jgi:hypothetical protein